MGFSLGNVFKSVGGLLGFNQGGGAQDSSAAAFAREQERLREERALAKVNARESLQEGIGLARDAEFSFGTAGRDAELDLTSVTEEFGDKGIAGDQMLAANNKANGVARDSVEALFQGRLITPEEQQRVRAQTGLSFMANEARKAGKHLTVGQRMRDQGVFRQNELTGKQGAVPVAKPRTRKSIFSRSNDLIL